MVAAVIRTCGKVFASPTAAKLVRPCSLHQRICPPTGRFSWSRVVKALGPTHHIPCAYQRLWGNKRPFFSVSLPDWGKEELCKDFPKRNHKSTLIIRSFPSEQLAKWAHLDSVPFTQLKIPMGAMSGLNSADELGGYLAKASKAYRSFDFQALSNFTSSKRLFAFLYSTSTDLLLVPPAISGGSGPQIVICEQIPLESDHIDNVLKVMLRFNDEHPFSLGLNK